VLEVNPRASRTVPFVAKATGVPIAKVAARVMTGEKLARFARAPENLPHVAVKEAVFPFARFPGVDVVLGPEMKSTGEVMGIDADFGRAFAKSQIAVGVEIPLGGTCFISVKDSDKVHMTPLCRRLAELGFKLMATRGTTAYLREQGLTVELINKVLEGRPHCVDAMLSGRIQLVFNTVEGPQAQADSFSLRRTALTNNICYYTTVSGARAAIRAIESLRHGRLDVAPLQSYFVNSF
jgi:carbamoyl-phosphate synthase large subunit